MPTLIVESPHYSSRTVQDALDRAIFNLRKSSMGPYDLECCRILENLQFISSENKNAVPNPQTSLGLDPGK